MTNGGHPEGGGEGQSKQKAQVSQADKTGQDEGAKGSAAPAEQPPEEKRSHS